MGATQLRAAWWQMGTVRRLVEAVWGLMVLGGGCMGIIGGCIGTKRCCMGTSGGSMWAIGGCAMAR